MSIKNIEKNTQTNETTIELLDKNMETQKKEVFSFFNYSQKEINDFNDKQEIFAKLGLNFSKILLGYRKYIDENLSGLNPKILNKIKKSIKIKLLNSTSIIDDLITQSIESKEDILSFRWILNERIGDQLGFINYELLPTANLYLNRDKIDFAYFDKSKKIEEIEEMLESDVDENGDFDEGFFSTQVIFDYNSALDSKILEKNKIEKVIGVDMLSEKDKQIEGNIMIKYIAFVSTMFLWYAGTLTSIPSDFTDLFSSEEGVFNTMKMYGLLNKEEQNYKMDKHWYDTLFGFAGLAGTVFGVQGVVKGGKLSKAFGKLEKLGLKTEEITTSITKYQESFKSLLFKGNKITKSSAKRITEGVITTKDKIINNTLINSGNKLDGFENIVKIFDITNIKKSLSSLGKGDKLELDLLLNVKDINLDNYLSAQINYLAKNLSPEEFSKLKIITTEKVKPIFKSEDEAINARIVLLKSAKKIGDKYNTKIFVKVEPSYIDKGINSNGKTRDNLEVMSYYSVAEIVARASLDNLHDLLIMGNRGSLDTIGNTSIIKNIKDDNRFSQYDIIVYNAVQRFNKSKDASKFLEDVYIAIKSSKEFDKWESKLFSKKGKSGLGKLVKMVDKKGWISGDLSRKDFISNMWKAFDKIEYLDNKLIKRLRRKGIESGTKKVKENITSLIEKHGLQLDDSVSNNLQFKFVDNGRKGIDDLLDNTGLHKDYIGATDKAGFQVQVTLKDEKGEAYVGWLFIPLKESGDVNFISPDYIYKKDILKLADNHKKTELLKGLLSESDNSEEFLKSLVTQISLDDLLKLKQDGVTLPKDILRLYNNLIDNGLHNRTTFYDFVINAPADLRLFSILDSKTTILAKGITKYNDFSFSTQSFEKVPTNYISVFHYTSLSGLAKIAIDGLIPRGKAMKSDIYVAANVSPINLKIAEEYDKTAPKGFSRQNSVYAYSKKIIDGEENQGKGGICLELKVDPKKVLVADANIVTEDSLFLNGVPKGTNIDGRKYWENTMTLFEYNKLSETQQKVLFIHPEIVIPDGVPTEYIKFADSN